MSPAQERVLVLALCLLGAARVAVFASAFPFFNNVDEKAQVDLVLKYARGHWPREPIERYDRSSGELYGMYGSWEYRSGPAEMPGGVAPKPMWELGPEATEAMRVRFATLEPPQNHEAHSPPVYYAIAAQWYRLGRFFGLEGGRELFWVRFLNAPLLALSVLAAWAFVRATCPARADLRVAAPLLVAFFPQDAFYAVNSDALSAPLVGWGLVLLARWMQRDAPGLGSSLALGLAAAAAVLVKLTNLPFALVLGAVLAARAARAWKAGRLRAAWPGISAAAFAAALPVLAWVLRNAHFLGDALGQAAKVEQLGWTRRGPSEWLAHPLFSPAGIGSFLAKLTAVWWRGEFDWHGRPLASAAADAFYVATTAVLLCAAVAAGFARRDAGSARGPSGAPSTGHALSWALVLLSVATLAVLSLSFEYGRSVNPSAQFPFFMSGRLVLGALVPFAVLYLDGAAWLLRPLAGRRGAVLAAALTAATATASEVALSAPVFASVYNLYNLP